MHTARNLFEKNIESAEDCIQLFDGVSALKTKLQVDWILRAGVVFVVSALDAYFHDKVRYRIGKYSLANLPPALARFEIPLSELAQWDDATRKGNVLRNWVTDELSVKPLQSPSVIAETLKLAGINSLWDTIEPDSAKKDALLSEFNSMIKRRNQIAHEGDRMTSRKSGKKLRVIDRASVEQDVQFAKSLVRRVEAAFPG